MDLIQEYFNFKERYLLEYCTILIGDTKDNSQRDYYFSVYLKTYIDTYYLETYDTIDFKERTKVTYKDICEEIKGKYYELNYQLENDKKLSSKAKEEAHELISKTYTYSLLTIIIDISNYNACNVLSDYEAVLKKTLDRNSHIAPTNSKVFNTLVRLIKKNKKSTENYLNAFENNTFFLKYDSYRRTNDKYKVKMRYDIKTISDNNKKIVVNKIYNSKEVFKEKIEQKLNLLNIMLLKRVLNFEECDKYFLTLPIDLIDTKSEIKDIMNQVQNNISKSQLVFIISYKEYINKRSILKGFEDYNFAIQVDLSKTKNIQGKLEEIENLDLFKYVIVEGIKDEDINLVTNYVMKGKEIFQDKYDFDSEEE